LTEEEAIEEIRVTEKVKEVAEKSENIVLARRTSQDAACDVSSELIQMPCLDVQRLRRQLGLVTDEGQEAKRIKSKDPDGAQGTIEQIANIEPCHWNKYWKTPTGMNSRGVYKVHRLGTILANSNCSCNIVWVLGNQVWNKSSGWMLFGRTRTIVHANSDCLGKALMSRPYQE
jgi:hypothetical protein